MVVCKTDHGVFFVNPIDVLYFNAAGSYCLIKLVNGEEFKISKNLAHVRNLFHGERIFISAHRSWTVNINFIEKVARDEKTKKYFIQLKGGYKIPIASGHTIGNVIKDITKK